MREFELKAEIGLPRPVDEVFRFFADAFNLEVLTPAWLRFEVITPGPIRMQVGTRIDYRLRIRGIPIHWQSQITEWVPPHQFTDCQTRGPYRYWRHVHKFRSEGGGTIAEDVVTYAPLGGWLTDRLFVRSDLDRIFRYRHERLREIFPGRMHR